MQEPKLLKQEWYTAAEIAALKLPDMPTTKQNVNELAKRKGWALRINEAGKPLARKRRARGGGTEYHYSVLPPLARSAVADLAAKLSGIAPWRRWLARIFDRLAWRLRGAR